ncbi:MAG: YlxR family protein [Firmicutes bacterium]|nr:YlxR family protein [Bacillota bacterium]
MFADCMTTQKYSENKSLMRQPTERTCMCCRLKMTKHKLIRITKYGASIELDIKHSKIGRGCYVCPTKKCTDLMISKKTLNRVYKCDVESCVYDKIVSQIIANLD